MTVWTRVYTITRMTALKKAQTGLTSKKMRTFRFSDSTIARLKDLSKATGKTMTQVLEELVFAAEVDDEL